MCVCVCPGVVRCQILNGEEEEAAQQLEFLSEIEQTLGRSAVCHTHTHTYGHNHRNTHMVTHTQTQTQA